MKKTPQKGSLTIIGTGIKMAAHITIESKAWLEQADRVFFLANTDLTADWIRNLKPEAIDLATCYQPNKNRLQSYKNMETLILQAVRANHRVCAVFYGHPGVFVSPSHAVIQQARAEGFSARMLPGISAEDCLFADLGLDPAVNGCQSFEATDFLIRPRRFDLSTPLILWQIGVLGNLTMPQANDSHAALQHLIDFLAPHYGLNHNVIVYQAALYPITHPYIEQTPLANLLQATITPISTLYIPPKHNPTVDEGMLNRLGLTLESLLAD